MYSRCLVCRSPFPETGVLGHLPRGDRVAYDPRRGRLWVVCRSCRRWSLAPLEERWEALEELEKLVTRGPGGSRGGLIEPRLLAETDNVSLFGVGALEIVRVGGADSAEEACWRYGRWI